MLSEPNIIGDENVRVASRMNQKFVVFVSDKKFGHDVVSTGLTMKGDHFITVSPMDTSVIKIIISNVPPFVSNYIMPVLSRYVTNVSGNCRVSGI